MIFDDWGIPTSGVVGLTGSDPFFGLGRFSDIGDLYGDQGITGLDRPGAGVGGGYGEDFGADFGVFGSVSVFDAIANTPFLISDEAVAAGEPAPGRANSFSMSYSMRMLIDVSGGGSFSRMSSWR